ncbi:MAG: DUF2721 domain-containing protein [Leptolyngbyaceae cyanobacterium SM1_3_5]|nr:DUF2721 domain-containing protein [Leptolyngbyaceae cyanobacterium SM1_3_5]
MVSTCTLIQSGVLGRYSNVGTRIRSLTRERAEFLSTNEMPVEWCQAGLTTIDGQLLHLSRRHRLIQKAVLTLYSAVLAFLFSMVAIAIAQMLNGVSIAMAALVLFLLGTGLLVIGVVLAALEVRISHQAVQAEMKWVMTLMKTALNSPPASLQDAILMLLQEAPQTKQELSDRLQRSIPVITQSLRALLAQRKIKRRQLATITQYCLTHDA